MTTETQTRLKSWELHAPYWSQANAIETLLGWMYRARKESNKLEYALRAKKEIETIHSKLGTNILYNTCPAHAIQFREITGSDLLSHQETY